MDHIEESFQFSQELQTLMLDSPPPATGSSFIALLGLPPNQAAEILREGSAVAPINCSPTFPTNAELVDRAARFSVFAGESSPEESNSGEAFPANLKAEPVDYCGDKGKVAGSKRKDVEKSIKVKAKKSKSEEENKLPYVHVRARRGQATDSHSLAERARREKINARMKLLQELVPGCSNISGTALVLDEIINHVQSLQRQVEFLSMRLAAVNPRIDCSELDNILSTECGRFTANSGRGIMPIDQSSWLDSIINGAKHQQNQQQIWLLDNQQPHQQRQQQQIWERDLSQPSHIVLGNLSINSHFAYDSSSPNSVSIPEHLKTEH